MPKQYIRTKKQQLDRLIAQREKAKERKQRLTISTRIVDADLDRLDKSILLLTLNN